MFSLFTVHLKNSVLDFFFVYQAYLFLVPDPHIWYHFFVNYLQVPLTMIDDSYY